MTTNSRSPKEIRVNHNRELIKRMQAGEPLNSYESSASWFPPRPVLEKDPEAVKRLYGEAANASIPKRNLPSSVVDLADRLQSPEDAARAKRAKKLKKGA